MYCDVKNLDIGSAERHWKTVKYLKTYQRGNTGDIKCQKQALIYNTSMQKIPVVERKKLALPESCGVSMIYKL